MKIGRNEPCPCGSGKKYEKCCLALEERAGVAGSGPGTTLREVASPTDCWQADVVPLPASIANDPSASPCAVLVVSDGLIVHTRVLARISPEPEDVAAELAARLLAAGDMLGASPRRLLLRHAEIVDGVADRLRQAGWTTSVEAGTPDELDDLADAAVALRGDMASADVSRAPTCSPLLWAGWRLSEDWCAEVFRAAAEFYRAAPWKTLWDTDLLEVAAPSGTSWHASVLGAAGMEFGLVLYADPEDPERILEEDKADAAGDVLRSPVLYLSFDRGAELPRETRKEVARAGWEVASSDAFPRLLTINTLAGGIRRGWGDDLVATLSAVVEFLAAHAGDVTRRRVEFHHEATGTIVRYPAAARRGAGGLHALRRTLDGGNLDDGPWDDDPYYDDYDDPEWEEDRDPALRLRTDLAPGAPEGPGARPEAAVGPLEPGDPEALLEAELPVLERFEAALVAEGLGRATVAKHVQNARYLLEFLARQPGIPLAAIHEHDLRVFLYDWYLRKAGATHTQTAGLAASLRRFFGHLAGAEGIRLPWAKALLVGERELFEMRWETVPEGPWWEQEVMGWRSFVWDDLETRVMAPDRRLAGTDRWDATMGLLEVRLHDELQRRWLLWRDELLRQGAGADPRALRDRLVERQRRWETEPHPELDGRSPLEAILAERRRRFDSSR